MPAKNYDILKVFSYEDRIDALSAMYLMAISLVKCDPAVQLTLFAPGLKYTDCTQFQLPPSARIESDRVFPSTGWSVKPQILLDALDQGATQVIWLDSDIIVNGPITSILEDFDAGELLVAEEWYRPPESTRLTALWRLPVGRPVAPINSCLLRFLPPHRKLLTRWIDLLDTDEFRRAQRSPFGERPPHLESDQCVLSALLGSAEFASVQFASVKIGNHLCHCAGPAGYSFFSRLRDIQRGLPTLIHCIGRKPWGKVDEDRSWLHRLEMDVSPYVLAAKRTALSADDIPPPWASPRTYVGAFLRRLFGEHVALTGAGLAAIHGLIRKRFAGFLIASQNPIWAAGWLAPFAHDRISFYSL